MVTPVSLEVTVKEKSEDKDNLRKPVQSQTVNLFAEKPTSERVKQELPTSEGLEEEMLESLSEAKQERFDAQSQTDNQEGISMVETQTFGVEKDEMQASGVEKEETIEKEPTEEDIDRFQRDVQNQTDNHDEILCVEKQPPDEEEVRTPEVETTDLDVKSETKFSLMIQTKRCLYPHYRPKKSRGESNKSHLP